MSTSLGEKIKTLRNDKGFTLEELAKKTGSSKSYIWELENKSIAKPSAEKLSAIATVLGVTSEYLMSNQKLDKAPTAKDDAFINKYKSLKPNQKKKYMKLIELFDKEQ